LTQQQQQQQPPQLHKQHVPQLQLQTPSSNRLQSAREKMEEAAARLREAQLEMEEANETERLARLTERSSELLTCYSQRIQELEQENRALCCTLLKYNGIEGTDSLPLPRFRAGHFQINGSDEEGEATGDNHHSLTGLFDIDWDHVGSKVISCVSSVALTRRPSPDSSSDERSNFEATTEATTAIQPPTSAQPKCSFNAAANFLALERLIHKLSEEDAKLIWLQFARYESEIGFLRSVISTYEDICLSGDVGGRHTQRTPRVTGRGRPLSCSLSARRPRSARRFQQSTPRGEGCSRVASARSCSFNSSASRRRRRVRPSAEISLQANPDTVAAGLPSIESFLEALPQPGSESKKTPAWGSESTTTPACSGSDGKRTGGLEAIASDDVIDFADLPRF